MSQPTSRILHKRSSMSGAVPALTSLSAGEIAINTASGKLFIKTKDDCIKMFLNADQLPYIINESLSSVIFQHGTNTITGLLAGVLGGIDNDVSGAGSTVVNGSDNDIAADYAIIGNGSNNKILSGGDFGAILGGQNNILNHQETFILGSNIVSELSGFVYVNNLSAIGKIYGDGSHLTGILAEGTIDTELRSLSSDWQNTYTTVLNNSASWNNGSNEYVHSNFLPLSGGTLTNTLTTLGVVYAYEDIEIVDFTKGIILTSPNNSKWKITVDDNGVLTTSYASWILAFGTWNELGLWLDSGIWID